MISLRNLSMSIKISFMAVLGVAVFGVATITNALSIMTETMTANAFDKLDSNLSFNQAIIHQYGDAYEIKDGKLVIGSMVLNENNELVDSLVDLGGGVVTIFQGDERIATNIMKADGSRAVGTKLAPGPVYNSIFKEGKPYRGESPVLGQIYFGAYNPIFDQSGKKAIGIIFVGMDKAKHMAAIGEVRDNVIMLSIIIGLVLAGSMYWVIRLQLKPMVQMERVMAHLQNEEVDVDVPAQNRGDEIGRMAKAVQSFKEGIVEKIRLRGEAEAQKQRAETERRLTMNKMADDFEHTVGNIVQVVASAATELQSSAKNLSEMADQTNTQTTAVAAATEEASASVQTVASAAEELSSSISEINRQIEQSTEVATEAVEEVKNTDLTVSTLSDAAAQIGDVVKLIQDIAEQTNLLALNATIEAARAGEAGKGFAVVASEVKNLANQTARATEEISKKIVTVQSVSTQAVSAIRSIGEIIGRIDMITSTIADAIHQQESATREISNNVQQASAGTSEISCNIVNVTHAASESRNAAGEVFQASGELSRQAEVLRKEIVTFVATVRQG
ncbi:MAG: methyl-accepting chemotaxis protein [Alphaproteobacteria bacterium]|nr:methyl-accepting chemotaxis protein [Alphaproteobacteria bacterium]